MEARAPTSDVLEVRRWRDGQERLLMLNFGEVEAPIDGEWRVLLSSGPETSTGKTVAPRTATILARDGA